MENRRNEIIDKAFVLFCRYGIKSVSMDDLAKELGMSKKTLYQFISDKNTVVQEVVEKMHADFKKLILVFFNSDFNAIEQHFEIGRNIKMLHGDFQPTFGYDLHKYYPKLLEDIVEEKNKLLEKAFLNNLNQGKEEGLYHADINEVIVSKILLCINSELLVPNSKFFSDEDFRLKEHHYEVYKYHFRAICTSKGVEEFDRQTETYNVSN
ncbi:MAG: TetR/AcrR family transcriptional regulator [Mangrovibacterium sp.]